MSCPILVNFGLGSSAIPCGDMHQSFTDALVYLFIYMADSPSQAVRVSFQPDAVHSIVLTLIMSGNLCPLKHPNVILDPKSPGVEYVEFRVALATVPGTGQSR